MTTTQFFLVAIGAVIGTVLGRLAYRAIRWALARRRAPGGENGLPVRLTTVNRRRLLVLLTDAANIGGGDIWRFAGGSSGEVWFGFLDKLEDAGLVTGEWETPRIGWSEPADSGSPRRRFYRLTPEGRAAAMKALGLKEGARQ